MTARTAATVVNGRTLTGKQALRLRDFSTAIDKGADGRDARLERVGVQGLRELAGEIADLNETDQAAADLAERLAIRAGQGETIQGTRIVSASGIDLAYRRGVLDGECVPADKLFQIGELYRAAFERANAMLTPVRHEVRGSGGLGASDAVLAAGKTLAHLRARQTSRHVQVLDHVCGWDLTAHRTAKLLRRGLRTIERLLREALVTSSHNHGFA